MDDTKSARRYEVLSELGSGGMGRVWRARDSRLGREVALKRLLPSLSGDPAAAERFLREARAAAAFSHPHAVHVYDVDRDEEGPFIAMEYVAGGSLADRLRSKGPLSLRESLSILREVGEALSSAHAAGILHRDVKPANVLLDSQGHPRLTDFGLALFEGKGELTRSLVGTPEYMAPEQGADPSQVDARTDVFSLAATLYACLTGEPPRIVRESRIPEAVRPALLKALSQRREDRFASMEAFLAALESAGSTRARKAKLLFALKIAGALGAAASIVSVGLAVVGPLRDRPNSTRTSYFPVRTPSPPPPPPSTPSAPVQPSGGEVAPAPRVEGVVEDLQVYKSLIDSGYALGFVVNKGEAPLEHARVELKLLDEQGKLVVGATGYVSADRVEPGGRFPIRVLINPWPKFAKAEAKVENGHAGFTRPSAKLEVVEKRLDKAQFSGWNVFARIRNADSVAASYPHVTSVLYAADGRIIGVYDGYGAAKSLEPGEETTVSYQSDSFGQADPARYDLYLFGAIER
ncbi:MAG TPA: protein kinase [Myxococcales bacterium]|jgi:serine/threonine protein kinase